MKTITPFVCVISICAALCGAVAQAQSLSVELITIAPGLTVTGTLNNGSFVQDYPSGVMHFEDFTNSTFFDAFCVQPSVSMNYGDTAMYQVQDISLLPNADTIARLVGGYLASVQSDPGAADANAAAVHWAIWEITSEVLQSPSLSDGNVRVITPGEQATADLANTYLANAGSYTPASLIYLTSDTGQNVVSWNVVPEPGTAALMAFSVLGFFRRRR